MRFAAWGAIFFVVLLAMDSGGSGGLRAQNLSAQSADIQALVKEYVAAWNAKDTAGIRRLLYSKALACITPANRDFYDGALAVQMRDPIPADYMVTVSAVNENNLKAIESSGPFPVKPTRELHIDYQQGEDGGSVILYLVRENGRWTEDFPCISEAALKKFHDQASENAKLLAHYKVIADGIKDPLRSQLLDLLRKHETGRANDRYHAASGQDMRTSMLVINALKEEGR